MGGRGAPGSGVHSCTGQGLTHVHSRCDGSAGGDTIRCATSVRHCLCTTDVRGSFSARVPRSSFARVRRVLVPHMEEEGEEQENEKEDEGEDGKQRVEGRVVESIKTTTS